jgi:ABC-type nickel/cobalt efflux system permease component RcnA
MDTQTTAVIIAVAIAVLVIAVVAWLIVRNRRSQELRRRFGVEYDRAVQSSGRISAAEADLIARTKRVEGLHIHPLSPGDRDRFAERWRKTQASFVDNPVAAVAEASALVDEVMRARGYPVADFEHRVADISVDHPQFVEHYREAHAISVAAQRGTARTEDLRRATIHYRDLFEDLLETAA